MNAICEVVFCGDVLTVFGGRAASLIKAFLVSFCEEAETCGLGLVIDIGGVQYQLNWEVMYSAGHVKSA